MTRNLKIFHFFFSLFISVPHSYRWSVLDINFPPSRNSFAKKRFFILGFSNEEGSWGKFSYFTKRFKKITNKKIANIKLFHLVEYFLYFLVAWDRKSAKEDFVLEKNFFVRSHMRSLPLLIFRLVSHKFIW